MATTTTTLLTTETPGETSMDLKVKELLNQVGLDYDSSSLTSFIHQSISTIKSAINEIPDNLKVNSSLADGFVRDIGADKVEFRFKKPEFVEISGSYEIQSIAKPYTGVDVFVRLPKECFHEKDYLNHRYHGKRCLYLCVINKYLSKSKGVKSVEWTTFQNEGRKPVLVVYLVQELAELPGFFIRIIPTATSSLFNVSKLKLTRNNLHNVNQEGNAGSATPKYNSSILEDMFLEQNSEFVRKAFLGWKELGEALILMKVWARDRSSIYSHDCFNGYILAIIMSYLSSKSGGSRISRPMKATQIFRVTLDFIASSKLWDRGLLLQPHGQSSVSKEVAKQRKNTITKEERNQYQELFPVVVLDTFAHFNLAFRLTRSGFLELQDEASVTINCMDKYGDGGFEEVFMAKVDFPARFDYCIRLNLSSDKKVHASGFCLDDECWKSYEKKVHLLLEQALTDRAKFIRVIWRSSPAQWSIEEGFSKFGSDPLLAWVCVSSCEKSFRVVDIGPNAENKEEALKFRKFWGEKAELRRFKDGVIAESTVWECGHWERHLIIKRISEHVLSRHLSLSKENIVPVADQLDFCLLHGNGDPISFCANLLEAFEVLSKRLRNLEGIPLRISSVQPLDSAFRLTSVFPPEPHPTAYEKGAGRKSQKLIPTCIQPLEVMIQLEGSGNWPMDDVAIEKTKSSFLLTIGERLQNAWGVTCTATEDDVSVLMSGYAFRLKILHERGLGLLKKHVDTKRISSADKELFIRGQHSSMINGLHGRYPIYGPVVRLAKRWVASHMFSSYVAEEAIELLVAHIFLKPLPFSEPCSRITGFLRFLRLLSNHDWAFTPLVIDINEDMNLQDKKDIAESFMQSRTSSEENAQSQEPAMFLATTYDKTSEAWTKSSPNSYELKRLVAYARSSADLLTNLIPDPNDSKKWECLFRTPLNNYDAVVLIHRETLSFPLRLLFPSEMKQGRIVAQGDASTEFHSYVKGSVDDIKNKVMVNFDPTKCFLQYLQGGFENTFKLWYDSFGSDAIGLTWDKPNSKKRVREESDEKNRDPVEILRNVGEVGKGFVRSVYLLKAPKLRN
ncbi:hypothetical protein ACHQM5_023031 [Ranunculus cassubicifolius]